MILYSSPHPCYLYTMPDTTPVRVPIQDFRRDLANYLAHVQAGGVVHITRRDRLVAECRTPAECEQAAKNTEEQKP